MPLRLLQSEIYNCEACILRQGAIHPVPGYGPVDYKAVVVGEAPGIEEDRRGRPFLGRAGELLRDAFKRNEVDVDSEIYLCNTVKCFPPKTPGKKLIDVCKHFLFKELHLLKKAQFVLLLGNTALQVLFPTYKIGAKRGQILRHPDYPDKYFFATYHPAGVLRNLNYETFFYSDVQAFWNFVQNGVPDAVDVKYYLDPSHKITHKYLKYLLKQEIVSFDIETTGLDPFANDFQVTLVSFSDKPGRAFVVPVHHEQQTISPANLVLLKELLKSKNVKKIAHNSIFDIKCLKAHLGIGVRGLVFDTMIAPYLQYGERRMAGLKDLAAEFTDMGHYEDELLASSGKTKKSEETFRNVPYEILSKYSAKDADATYRLYDIFRGVFEDEGRLGNLLKMYLKVVPAIVDMELEGWVVDKSGVAHKLLSHKLKKLQKKIYELSSVKRYLEKHDDKINLRSSQQKAVLLRDYAHLPLFKKTDKGADSVDKEVLVTFAPESKLCAGLLKYSGISKLLSTYTNKMIGLASDDGRLRTHFNITQTGSSRLSSSSPNLQNIPKKGSYATQIKNQFLAPKGYLICEGDYQQEELRIFSIYANDRVMLPAYRNNEDIHTITTCAIYGITKEQMTKQQRSVGKMANFALIYGISPNRLRIQLMIDGGIHMTEEEAKVIHRKFHLKYPDVIKFHQKVEKFVMKHGYIDTKFGFRRFLPAATSMDQREQSAAFRVAYNHPIQGTCSGILFETLVRVRKALKGTPCKLLSTVHDSVFIYAPENGYEKYAKLLKESMEDMHYDWLKIPIPAAIKVGETWGDLKEIEI